MGLQGARVRRRLAGGRTSLDVAINAGTGNTVRLTGSAPLAPDGPLDVKIDGALDARLANSMLSVSGRHAAGSLAVALQLRGTIALPNGLGKDVKIAVFAQGEKAREAEEAGADVVGAQDLAKRVQEGFDDFDVVIATPDMMSVVGQLGRILGPAGKMPNPKVGTVTMDVAKAVEESKSGKVEYRTDRTAIVHMVIGKASFEDRKLLENYAAVIEELIRAKPSAAKGRYLRTITLASTMGPGVKVDSSRTREIIEEAPAAA